MNLAHLLLSQLTLDTVAALDRESAIFAFQNGAQLPADALTALAQRFPIEALTHARDLLDDGLVAVLANAAPASAISAKLGMYLSRTALTAALLEDPRLLAFLDAATIDTLPESTLLELFALDPVVVLACAAAVERLPRASLAEQARAVLAYDRSATAYPLRMWSTYKLEGRPQDVWHMLFTVPLGQQGQGFGTHVLTLLETNMHLAAMAATQQPVPRVRAIRYRLEGVTKAQADDYAGKIVMRWAASEQYIVSLGILSDAIRRFDDLREGAFFVPDAWVFCGARVFDLVPTRLFRVEFRVAPDVEFPRGTRLRVTLDCADVA